MFIHKSTVMLSESREEYRIVFLSGESSTVEDMASVLEEEGYGKEVTKKDDCNNVTHIVLSKFASI